MTDRPDHSDSLLSEHFLQTRRHLRSLLFRIWGGGFLLVIFGFTIAWFYVQPAPPRTIVMATGPKDGAYFRFGEMYADFLRKQGITLELRSSAGALENYDQLQADNGVDLAIVQGGTASSELLMTSDIESLASLYFEPVWVFYRSDESIADVRDLTNKRIAIGRENSGTAAIARILLTENGIGGSDSNVFIPSGGRKAMVQLLGGEVDVAIFVSSPSSSLIRELIASDDVRLLSFERHEAYTRRHPFLTSVTLERGVIDLENDRPRADVQLIAPAANLVANESLHDALIPLLLRTARETHQPKGSLFDPGRLPSTEFVEFPMNSSALRYFDEGPPFLQRYLPFWVASFIDRGKILLLPAITLLLPLFRIAPPLYRWSIRSRIYRWYEILRGIESDLRANVDQEKISKHAKTLSEMEGELDDLRTVPLSYMEEFYNLRLHVEFVERRVNRVIESTSDDEPQEAAPRDDEPDDENNIERRDEPEAESSG